MFAFIQSKKDYKAKFQEKFGETMSRDEVIAWVEENGMEQELEERVNAKWEDFEDSIKSNRKKKYYAKQPESEE
jgi:malate synthase